MKSLSKFREISEAKKSKPKATTSVSWAVKIDMLATKIQKSEDVKEQLSLIAEQNQYLGYIMAVYAPD